MSFDYPIPLADLLLEKLQAAGIEKPFEIQTLAAEPVLNGEDCKILAPTGSGKTLSYLLPLITAMENDSDKRLLVLAASPELASQISAVYKQFFETQPSILLVGGANLARQKERLKKRPKIIFATPGRAFELFVLGDFKVTDDTTVVLDEIDSLIERHNNKKVGLMTEDCGQLVAASATYGDLSEAFFEANAFNMKMLETKKREGSVSHHYLFSNENKKEITLTKLLRRKEFKRVLLFVNELEHTNHLFQILKKEGIAVGKLDSKTHKNDRATALKDFRSGKIRVLISTDSLARGIDLPDVTVVQYAIARDEQMFIHRGGRAGRAGGSGANIMLVTKRDVFMMSKYSKKLGVEINEYVFTPAAKKEETFSVAEDGDIEVKKEPVKTLKKKQLKKEAAKAEKPKKKKRWRDSKGQGKFKGLKSKKKDS
ncbi:MAG: DEAD/DEAH box helicase [Lentisphaeraceae bacterium]|nr:DEAD/DEAH box helicase [Lentisphaeraceae bacterium]